VSEGLLDTTVLVGLLRRQEEALAWLRRLPEGTRGSVSVVSVFELLRGCRRMVEQRALERQLSEFRVLGISESISELGLRWYKTLHLSKGVGFLDCLIGATAKHHGLVVFTHNTKHFQPMRGLRAIVPY
jgi:predicted nucleic acid-binding protein